MIQFENAVKHFNEIILTELSDNNICCWLAGGCLRDYFSGNYVRFDYDLFFPDSEEYKKTVEYFKSKSAEIRYESEYGVKFKYNGKIFDIVKMTFDSPNDTIEAFDFTCCMFAAGTENIYHGDNTFIDLSKRQLMINKITYPASTLKRAIKYCSRGYAICDGELKKIVESIRNMEVEPEVEETEEISSGDEMRMFRGID